MTNATFSQRPHAFPVTRLRLGRLILLVVTSIAVLLGGTVWLLRTQGKPLVAPLVDSTAWPAWLKQAQTYPAPEVKAQAPVDTGPDPLAAQLAAMRAQMI